MTAKHRFSINRNLALPLAEQVADGLRKGIDAGLYRAGDTLPSYAELADALGVSSRVTCEAVKMLAAEGRVLVRPRSGCRVVGTSEKVRRGRILAVLHDYQIASYHAMTLVAEVMRRAVAAGFQFETVYVPIARNGICDMTPLEDALRSPFSLVFSYHAVQRVERRLGTCGIPYVFIGDTASVPGAAMRMSSSSPDAVNALARRCVALGVTSAWVAGYGRSMRQSHVASELAAAGIAVEWMPIQLRFGFGFLQDIERAGYETAMGRFAAGRPRPDAAIVLDDYYLRGVLSAFARLGIGFPRDIRLAGLVNAGFAPATPVPLACMLVDGRRGGADIFDGLVSVMEGRNVPHAHYRQTNFIDGESLSGNLTSKRRT